MITAVVAMLMLTMAPAQQPVDDRTATAGEGAPAEAGEESTQSTEPAQLPEPPAAPPPVASRTDPPAPVRQPRLAPFTSLTTMFDSNVNRDTDDLHSFGAVAGIGATFKNDPRRPTLEVQYQAGFHQYANTNRWDRVSHYLRTAWEHRLTRRLYFEQVGEVSIKGSTEDHELSNQGVLSPRFEYRMARWLRLRALGVWRVKRYDDTPDRNAFNRYAGLEILGRPASGIRWTVGARAELNATVAPRQRYERRTWYLRLSAPVSKRDRIEFGAAYRHQRYPYRFVDVAHGPDVLRRDDRVEPEIDWWHTLGPRVELRVGYVFDGRDSNDERRDYRSHQAMVGVVTRW